MILSLGVRFQPSLAPGEEKVKKLIQKLTNVGIVVADEN
jgi:hypothetical protein